MTANVTTAAPKPGGSARRQGYIQAVLVPLLSVLTALLVGAVVIENVFNIPGLGRLLVQSVVRRDIPVVQGAVMTVAAIEVLVMLGIDLLYVYIDPRIRYGAD